MILMATTLYTQEKKLDFKNKDNTTDAKTIELTIDDAVNLALKNNLGLEGERLKIEQKKLALYTSWNVFLPSMSFTTSMARLNDDTRRQVTYDFLTGAIKSEFSLPEWTPSFSFDLTSTFNAAMVFSIYNTVYDYQAGKISLETAEKKLIKDIKKNFYSLLLLKENIKLMEDNILNVEKKYKQAQVSYKNGLIPEFNVLQVQVAYENLKPALQELKNNYEIAKFSFKQTIGLKREVNLNLNGNLELPAELNEYDPEKLIEKYVEKRLDVQSMNLTLKTLNNVKNISIAGLTPSFLFKFTADPKFTADITNTSHQSWYNSYNKDGGDKWKKKDSDLWKQSGGMLMFAVSLPLDSWLPFSKEQMGIINANFNIKQSEVGLRQMKLGAELEIQSLTMKIAKSKSSISNLKLNIALAEKAYKMADEAYKAGSKEFNDVQDQELEKRKAEINLLQEQYNYLTAILDLEYATNSNLKDEVKK